MRTVLYTGKGGVAKTSVAAATALKAANSGKKKVLVMSTDPAHSLSDAFDEEVGPDPKEMASGVWAQEVDQARLEAVTEAVYTVEEQRRRERERHPPV